MFLKTSCTSHVSQHRDLRHLKSMAPPSQKTPHSGDHRFHPPPPSPKSAHCALWSSRIRFEAIIVHIPCLPSAHRMHKTTQSTISTQNSPSPIFLLPQSIIPINHAPLRPVRIAILPRAAGVEYRDRDAVACGREGGRASGHAGAEDEEALVRGGSREVVVVHCG